MLGCGKTVAPELALKNDALTAFVRRLGSEYEPWYTKAVRQCYAWWIFLQLAILSSGSLTSILAGLNMRENKIGDMGKISMIVLPILGTALTAIVVQFRIFDLWRIREQGRIEFQALYEKGLRLSATVEDQKQRNLELEQLQERTRQIEQDQSNLFFGLAKSDLVLGSDVGKKSIPLKIEMFSASKSTYSSAEEAIISASVVGGRGPYTYSLSLDHKDISEIKEISSPDGRISQRVKLPVAAMETDVRSTLVVKDSSGESISETIQAFKIKP